MPELWPPSESEVAQVEAILVQIPILIAELEQTLSRAKANLADLNRDASRLHEFLTSKEFEQDRPRLADIQAAQHLRAELVRAAQQSVAVSQTASRYLQAREKFLQARRVWAARPER